MKISEIMTPDPIAVGPETPLKDVAAILLEHGISGVPVIGERLEVLGVVSEADIIATEVGPDPRDRRLIAWFLGGRHVDRQRAAARTAAEAMASPAISVGARKTVAEAARLMTEHEIKRLPVVNDEGTSDRDRHSHRPRPCVRPERRGDRARDPRDAARDPLGRRTAPRRERRAWRGPAGRQDGSPIGRRASGAAGRARPRSARRALDPRMVMGRRAPREEERPRVSGGSGWSS